MWVERVLYKNFEYSINVILLVVVCYFFYFIGYIIIMCWVNDFFNIFLSKKKIDFFCRE